MSGERKPKQVKPEIEVFEKGLVLPENLRQGHYQYYGQDIIPRSNYPIGMLDDLIKFAPYANLCLKKRVEIAVGNGFNTINDPENKQIPTDQWFIDNIDINQIRNAEYERLKYPDIWLELPVYDNDILSIYHIPTSTMSIGYNKLKGYYVQYAGIKDRQTLYKPFDIELYKKGQHPNGTFVYHWKHGNDVYGKPIWIDGLSEIMKITKSEIRSVLSYYDNNAQSIYTDVYYGQNPNDKQTQKLKAEREAALQGADKNGKGEVLHVSTTFKDAGKAYERFEHARDIISQYNLEMLRTSYYDIVAMLETPHFVVGLKQAGQLGGSEEAGYITQFFISGTIQPAQRFWYELFNVLKPGLVCQFNTMEMPKVNEKTNNDITINKGSEDIATKIVNDLIQIENKLTEKAVMYE